MHPGIVDIFETHKNIIISGAAGHTSKTLVVLDFIKNSKNLPKTFLWVTDNKIEAEIISKELNRWGGIDTVTVDTPTYGSDFFAQRNDVFKNPKASAINVVGFLSHLIDKKQNFIVIPYYFLLQKFPSPAMIKNGIIKISSGDKIDIVEFFEKLIEAGYEVADDYQSLQKGQYMRSGGNITIWPVNSSEYVRFEIDFDSIGKITTFQPATNEQKETIKECEVFPIPIDGYTASILDYVDKNIFVVEDELDVPDDIYDEYNGVAKGIYNKSPYISLTPFNEDTPNHTHLHYLSILKYRAAYDFATDMKTKKEAGWLTLVFTKNKTEIANVFNEYKINFSDTPSRLGGAQAKEINPPHRPSAAGEHRSIEQAVPRSGTQAFINKGREAAPQAETFEIKDFSPDGGRIILIEVDKNDSFPYAFQNPTLKLALVSDREISMIREAKHKAIAQRVILDFLTGLKPGDFVVHADHGIAKFLGLDQRTIDGITREYMTLGYAENDKLFVPIDQSDKVSKYIGSEDLMPRLTRLGSVEWVNITNKVKKETEKIAKELLQLYASRKVARGFKFSADDNIQAQFEEKFQYEPTPGQIKAFEDVKHKMESNEPMDLLVCGDVGFGKTEVAMRAAFKAVRNGKQAALISPITILADQHYRSFSKRMDDFNVRVEMLSRFKTKKEQKEILEKLKKGEIDVIIGTHRLLQPDVKFKDLGLLVVDEEQRFGVKQKEKLKQLRAEMDVLILTATPIPRTLNIALNRLRDITTITTPPPGRLPVITEVRQFSMELIRQAILFEVKRGGQVYFLHNRVQTIDSMADKLRSLVPEARFIVSHGKLNSDELEERIIDFKDHKYDVLVTSTIIENGIDLANANTLIVNRAERFGLAQLYQLRGRVGRSKTQAYAYFMYHGQRLQLDAKRRLKAIVEASDLGSGFQIAMKDLEIRGAGDILGVNQHGVVNVVGVSLFIRMLNKAVEDLKTGKAVEREEIPEVTVELPLTAYIPDSYIVSSKDKINVYQKMAAADTFQYLNEIKEDVFEEYGNMPKEVLNLFKIIEIKLLSRDAGIVNIKNENNIHVGKQEMVLYMSDKVKAENIANLLQYNPGWQISGAKLRVLIKDLGMDWVSELKECLLRLGKRLVSAATGATVEGGMINDKT
ncbi:transcription-repair coupling factor [Candidatus Peregrinibacteria bacterium]|nr:transcription-repair coupling factor [Candidatus Peregrinibacteria bacterium]